MWKGRGGLVGRGLVRQGEDRGWVGQSIVL